MKKEKIKTCKDTLAQAFGSGARATLLEKLVEVEFCRII